MLRAVLRFLVVAIAFGGPGFAQGISITAPPDRFVAPGGFATLVFRLEATVDVEVDATVSVDAGWTVLRPPGRVALEVGRSTPIAVTVEVPSDAPAGVRVEVRFEATAPDGRVERVVVLTPTERLDVSLQAPSEFTLGGEELEVVVTNGGNVEERATLKLSRDGALLDRFDLVLAAGAREVVRVAPAAEGLHALVLTTERGAEVRRSLRVLRFGTGLDQPFVLTGEVGAAIGTAGQRTLTFGVKGALSDFVAVDALIDAAVWSRSFALVEGADWSVRAGTGWRDPFRLPLPVAPGLAGTWSDASWGVAAHAGWVGEDRFGGGASVAWSSGATRLAGGFAMRAGEPALAVRVEAEPQPGRELVATGDLRGSFLEAELRLDVAEERADSRLAVGGRDLAGATSRLLFGVRHRVAESELYADATLPIGLEASASGRIGFRAIPTTPLAGAVELALQAGTDESFLRGGYRTEVGGGWRVGAVGGVRLDAQGFGITFDGDLVRTGADPIDVDAHVDYRPATGSLGGRVSARARFATEPVDLSLAFGWNLTDRDVAAGAVGAWGSGNWSWALDATVGYGYGAVGAAEGPGRWRADLGVGGAYAFEVTVPASVAERAGGRRAGVLEGRAATEADEPLAGVELSVGRFRAITDEGGAYRLELVPGRYDVEVDVATVPIAYRLTGATRASVEVVLRATTTFDVPVARTTVLRGRVLEDRDGDGVVDDPARPVAARVRVVDAVGIARSVAVDANGRFEVRGLPAGEARVEVFDLALGASVVGDAVRTVVLEPGAPVEATILVRPVPSQVPAFGGGMLRIRSVAVEVARVPPGAAPLVRVQVAGDADSVAIDVGGERVALEHDGAIWIGRVPVPTAASAGVLPFVVVARAGDDATERRDQLVIDPEAPLVEVSGDGPTRAGTELRLAVVAYLEAVEVTADGPFGAVVLAEGDPGRWSGLLAVPSDAADAVVELTVDVRAADGLVATVPFRFRVLVP